MTHPFPGGTNVSRLTVYDWPTTDGAGRAGGGTPHLHTASDEGYVVLAGSGAVQTIGPQGYAEHPLVEGDLFWFEPGVVHRLVNDGGLEILVVMSNAGLPEAGDAIMTFGADVLADRARYQEAAALPGGADEVTTAQAARARRDLAVEGFLTLREEVMADGPAEPVRRLHAAAAALVQDRARDWSQLWAQRVRPTVDATTRAMVALEAGRADHLATARISRTGQAPGAPRFGMCGRLRTWPAVTSGLSA